MKIRLFVLVSVTLIVSACTLNSTKLPQNFEDTRKVAVFDIDGTLTPTQNSIYKIRPGASEAVQSYANAGYKIIYLSARVPFFQFNISNYLSKNNFPEGDIHVPRWGQLFTPHDDFKTRVLKQYAGVDWSNSYAFGDSSTDYIAYTNALIPESNIVGLKRVNEDDCEEGPKFECWNGWLSTLPGILD